MVGIEIRRRFDWLFLNGNVDESMKEEGDENAEPRSFVCYYVRWFRRGNRYPYNDYIDMLFRAFLVCEDRRMNSLNVIEMPLSHWWCVVVVVVVGT